MAGLIALGQDMNRNAVSLGGTSSVLEARRNAEQGMAEDAEKNQALSMTLTGAATGAQLGGPWGAGIGALAGFLGSKIF